MTGGASVWDGFWLAFKVVPKIPSGFNLAADLDYSAARFRGLMGSVGKLWEPRPLGHLASTGSTGAQAPFGATKGTRACTAGDPRWLDEGGYSMTGLGLRHISYLNQDGSPFDPDLHPGTGWYSGIPDPRLSTDLLGKSSTVTPNSNRGFGGPDDQHAGFNAEAAAGLLLGSPLAQDWFTDLVRDHATTKGPDWDTSAARSLRAQQDLCYGFLFAWDQTERDRALKVLEWGLQTWESHTGPKGEYMGWAGGKGNGPVKPFSAGGPDERVLCCGNLFWTPWNESQGSNGWQMARAIWKSIGRVDMVARYDAMLKPNITTCLRYGVIRNPSGVLLPINGVKWNPNGGENPPSYYEFNRPGVGTQGTVDLLLGDAGWWKWWGAVLSAATLYFPPNSFEYNTAIEILQANPPSTIEDAEWLSVGNP
jgi:hypothetical protein